MSDPEKQLTEMDAAFRKEQAEFRQLVDSIQGYEPRDKAEAWLEFVAKHIHGFGDQEALVYLRSRGQDCDAEIDELESDWKCCAEERVEECAGGQVIEQGDGGKTEHHGGMPLAEARDVKKHSPFVLRDFWGGRLEQEHSIDATMLRTVEGCEIGGFEDWWERMAKRVTEDVFHLGVGSPSASFWLFCLCRSDCAIELMGQALERALEAIEMPIDNEPYPWRVLQETEGPEGRRLQPVPHLAYASSIVFCNHRLRSSQRDSQLVNEAVKAVLREQSANGAWPCWGNAGRPSIGVTAMCLHALSLGKPRGWDRAAVKAVEWLWSVQKREGYWSQAGQPDAVYLTVLVLDAIDLASAKRSVTFRLAKLDEDDGSPPDDPPPHGPATTAGTSTKPRPRGRPKASKEHLKRRARVFDGWKTGQWKDMHELAEHFTMPVRDAKRMIDAERKAREHAEAKRAKTASE